MLTRVLVAARDDAIASRLKQLLRAGEIESLRARDLDELWETLTREDFDLLLVDRTLLPSSLREFLSSLQGLPEHPGVIVISDEDKPNQRAELLASGALAVLWLGLDDTVLGDALLSLARRQGDEVLGRLSAERAEKRSTLDDFISQSPTMQRFLQMARRVVKGDSALLILGETGVGKERLARSIHSESRRSDGPFITVNCGALPETLLESELFGHEEGAFTGATRARRGYFELAHKGTIFLDEIGEMPLHLQVKLLRVLEDHRVRRVGSEKPIEIDVRIVAATNRDAKQEVDAQRFRADLYYRLAVVTLTVPPLRERLEDLPQLAEAFLERSRRQLGRNVVSFRPDAMEAMQRHDWPGNVRELINMIERAVLLAPRSEIRIADLRGGESWTLDDHEAPASPRGASVQWESFLNRPFSEAREALLSAFEANYLAHVLSESHGRIGESATLAGLNERTLYGMMKRHGLQKEDFKKTRPVRSR
jgi:two-component system response regulator AtoC